MNHEEIVLDSHLLQETIHCYGEVIEGVLVLLSVWLFAVAKARIVRSNDIEFVSKLSKHRSVLVRRRWETV